MHADFRLAITASSLILGINFLLQHTNIFFLSVETTYDTTRKREASDGFFRPSGTQRAGAQKFPTQLLAR